MSNNTYNKLEDQGWEKMKAMLDAEMPVEGQPKRRVLFWWWTGAAAILVLVASIVLFDTNRNTEEIASQLENETKISTNNQAEISDNQQPTNKSSYNSIDPNLSDESSKALITSDKSEKKSSNLNNTNFSSATNPIASTPSAFTPEERNFPASEIMQEENNDLQTESAELTFQSSKSEEKRDALIPVAALNGMQNQGVKMEPGLASKLAVEPVKFKKTVWRVQSGVLMEDFSQLRGWNLSFAGNWILKNPRWSLQAGLGYAKINQPMAYFSNTDEDSFLEEKLNGPDSMELAGYNNYDISRISGRERFSINQSYHFLEIPLRINYKISPKWELYSGIKPSFRFEFPEKSSAEYLSVSADSGSFNNSVYTIPVEFPTFNLHALGGIQFHAGKHIYLWTQWEQNIPTQQRLVSFVNSRLAIGAGFQW